MLCSQRYRGIDPRVPVAARWVRLHARGHQFVNLPEAPDDALRDRRRRIRLEKSMSAFQRFGGASKTVPRQDGGRETRHRGPAYLKRLRPGAIGQELQTPAAL